MGENMFLRRHLETRDWQCPHKVGAQRGGEGLHPISCPVRLFIALTIHQLMVVSVSLSTVSTEQSNGPRVGMVGTPVCSRLVGSSQGLGVQWGLRGTVFGTQFPASGIQVGSVTTELNQRISSLSPLQDWLVGTNPTTFG
jgi:hypothetical protein